MNELFFVRMNSFSYVGLIVAGESGKVCDNITVGGTTVITCWCR